MNRPYTVPPGYDGSRFTTSGGTVRPREDSTYTLSVDGVPRPPRTYETKAPRPEPPDPVAETPAVANDTVTPPSEADHTDFAAPQSEAPHTVPAVPTTSGRTVRRARKSASGLRTASGKLPPLSSLTENGDMLLILLIFLLAGSPEGEGVVPFLALLLAVR